MRFAWDLSTSIIGVSVWHDDWTFAWTRYCDLRKLPPDPMFEKCEVAEDFVRKTIKDGEFDNLLLVNPAVNHNHHYIEERLGNFAGGRSMLQVLMKLAAFNQLVSWFIYRWDKGSCIRYIHPSTAKAHVKPLGLVIPKGSKEKKELTVQFVRKIQPLFPYETNKNGKTQPWCFDMADAYIIGLTGQKKAPCLKNTNSEASKEPLESLPS